MLSIRALCASAAIAGSLVPVSSFAQERPEEAASSADTETIVVTARRRAERLEDIPTAATVLDANTIAERGGASNTLELLSGQAGTRVNGLGTPLTAEISLRGSPTARSTNGETSVGLYRDGLYVAGGALGGRNFSRLDLFDSGRVEVLRGTQGALYGRNAVGGAINIVSQVPVFENTGSLRLNYGAENENLHLEGIANVRLAENMAVRLGVFDVEQGAGFYTNSTTGNFVDDNNYTGFRGQFRWQGESTDLIVRAESFDGYIPAIVNQIFIDPRTGFPNGYYQPPRDYPLTVDSYSLQEVESYAVLLTHDFGWAEFTSATNWRNRHSEYLFDFDGVEQSVYLALRTAGVVTANVDTAQNQFRRDSTDILTQDIHLSGSAFEDRLDWLVGAEWLSVESDSVTISTRTPTVPNPSTGSRSPMQTSYESWAVYGSAEMQITPRATLGAELRYTSDERSGTSRRFDLVTGLPIGGSGFVVDFEDAPDNISYNVTLGYRLNDDLLGYAKLGTSYRAGGFNTNLGTPSQPIPIPATFDNEITTSYELGLKGAIVNNVYLQAAVYQTFAEDLIVQLNNGCFIGSPVCSQSSTAFSANAGEAELSGAELELVGRFEVGGGRLRLSGSVSTQEGEVTSGAFAGEELAQVPDWIYGANINYRRPFAGQMAFVGNVNYASQLGGRFDLADPTNYLMAHEETWNTRLALELGNYAIAVWATNLSDKDFPINRGPSTQRWNQPRNYGVELRYNW